MDIILTLVLFALGFFILVKGAEILVHGAVAVANVFKVSTWFIGAVIVSIGTSIPELSINLASVFSGNDVGIATILGSNIFNVLVVLGVMALFTPVVMQRSWVLRDLITFVFLTVFAGVLILFPIVGESSHYGITTGEAIVLLGVFIAWISNMIRKWDEAHENLDFEVVTVFTAISMIVGGLFGVFIGGNWVVDGAVLIATIIGVSPATIGLTIVALGTSLPEFVVSFVAFRKGSLGLAVGNIVGSSIFNLFGVLGVTGIIREITITEGSVFIDVLFVLAAALLWLIFMFTGKNYQLSKFEGTMFLSLYALFIFSLFIR